jgi:hypothetical protein
MLGISLVGLDPAVSRPVFAASNAWVLLVEVLR